MYKKNFQSTVRHLLKNPLFSVINVVGLAVGLAACLLILLYVQNESSYDKHWRDADRIYRLHTTFDLPGREPYRLSTASALLVPALDNYFPKEIEASARAWFLDVPYSISDDSSNGAAVAVDASFTNIFDLEVISGSIDDALADNTGIALSEEYAVRYFGSTDVLGDIVTLEYTAGDIDYQVRAVYRKPSAHTVLEIPALIRLDVTREPNVLNTWTQVPVASFIKLKSGVDPEVFSSRLNQFSDDVVDISAMNAGPGVRPSERLRFDMANIQSLYLDSGFEDVVVSGNKTTVQAFSVIAVLILFIAAINFTVLSMSDSLQRAPDVAIRKVMGARRRELMTQYLGESLMLVFIAMILAVMLAELALPIFENLLEMDMAIDYFSPITYMNILVLLGIAGLVGGLYPAVILTRFNPARILKSDISGQKREGLSVKNALVVFQFGISIALIIVTGIIYLQVQYVSNRDPGFDKEKLVFIYDLFYRSELAEKRELLQQEVESLPTVESASLASYRPMSTTAFARISSPYGVDSAPGESFILANTFIDTNYFSTFDMPIVAGRDFSSDRDASGNNGGGPAIINEAAARMLGFDMPEEALGRILFDPRRPAETRPVYTVTGVVADSQYYSLRAEPRPQAYFVNPDFTTVLAVKYTGDGQESLDALRETWTEVMGDETFSAEFLDPVIALEFAQERREGQMFIAFSLFAVFIACLGLYGSATYTTNRRTKEIGIRKVMGAEVREIVTLLMWQFSKPVLVANIIAWPAAMWVMLKWLQRFPYQIDTLLLIPLCVLAGFIALSIAWLTVAGNTVKVATTNPVYALRYE